MKLVYETYETLTAGELRNKLKGVSNDDGNLRIVHPIEYIQRETLIDCSGFNEVAEKSIILHLPEDFYYAYDCKPKRLS